MTYRKKLIEVALPLEAINRESAREKSIRHGHPSTLHLWWSRKPLATCRAVLFAQLVDDPSSHPDLFPTEEAQQIERQRLFDIIEQLVLWENVNNEQVLEQARAEIHKSAGPEGPPPLLDPFAGGGSIPLEAQRLGLEAHASDLNPVAVLINKALIEIPPKFANSPPVHPDQEQRLLAREWRGAAGLAEDVRYYGRWMHDEAERRIGYLYPKVRLPAEYGGGEATVIAWLWARVVKCPNPACGAQMPLISSFWLAKGRSPQAWIEPVIDREGKTVRFEIRTGKPTTEQEKRASAGTVLTNEQGRGAKATFKCIICERGIAKGAYIDEEASAKRMTVATLAIVAEGERRRIFLPFEQPQVATALAASQQLAKPSIQGMLPTEATRGTFASNAQGRFYGFRSFSDYFTNRQLVALATFAGLVQEVREQVHRSAAKDGETTAVAYADAVAMYLAFALDRLIDRSSTICSWDFGYVKIRNTFARQAIPMTWSFAEGNPFSESTGNFLGAVEWVAQVIEAVPATVQGWAIQSDATRITLEITNPVVSTDPPYYANVSYADLSDFFYVWLRRSLGQVFPDLLGTLLVPKAQELVFAPQRFENKERARHFFREGLEQSFRQMRHIVRPDSVLTFYYALRQEEESEGEVASTGWETMLEGLIRAGFAITGTWPIRTELLNRVVGHGANILASSIVLVCRPRAEDAPLTTRRDFLNALKRELPSALRDLQRGNVAPVDLAQASIGPGMAIYSRYRRVLEADGTAMTVRTALALINQALDEFLTEQESEYDADTRWALAWFEQYGSSEGPFGDAETLCKAKNTSVEGMVGAGFLAARAGKVRLLRREELDSDWDPAADRRLTVWEVTQHLIRAMETQGETVAAELLARVGGLGEAARDLAYRLYVLCERKGWAQEALPYNGLVLGWGEVQRLSKGSSQSRPVQMDLGL